MAKMDTYKLCYGLFLICEVAVLYCNCQTTTLAPINPVKNEGNDVTFVCTVSSEVPYVIWMVTVNDTRSYSVAMGIQNGQCAISPPTSILSDTEKYFYDCKGSVYYVTVKNIQRDEHNHKWSCFPGGQSSGPTSTINVQFPVSSVSITPTQSQMDVIENTVVLFTCQATARPDATVAWYKVESEETSLITHNITTNTDDGLGVTTSILSFAPTRQQNGVQIFCKAKNAANKKPVVSSRKTLNVLYEASGPVITQGNEYQVTEGSQGQLSCTIKGGHPAPTLSWNCNILSPTLSETSNNGVITKTLTWIAVRGSDDICSCTSQQLGFTDTVVSVNVIVLPDVSAGNDIQHKLYIEERMQTEIMKEIAVQLKTIADTQKEKLEYLKSRQTYSD